MNVSPALRVVFALSLCALVSSGCTKVGTQAESGAGAAGKAAAGAPGVGASGAEGSPLAGGVPGAVVYVNGSGPNPATQSGTLRIGDTQDIGSLNPHLLASTSLGNLSEMTMAYFARFDGKGQPIPELLTEIPTQENGGISKDGLSITWHLRKGVKWSDGAPFDADDVVFSTKVVQNPANNEIGRDGWDLIEKIDEPDKYTVVYHLRKPYAAYLPTFFGTAGANPCILPKHILAAAPNINNVPYNSLPVGIGPFRYVKWVRSDHVELEPNPNYWRGTPKLKKVIYKFIPDINTLFTQVQTGEVDLAPFVSANFYERYRALPGHALIRQPSSYFNHIDFNMQNPILGKNQAVRDALRYATNRAAIREKISHGLGVLQEGMMSPISVAFDPKLKLIPFDLAKAGALLDADGWKPGPDGVRARNGQKLSFNFALPTGGSDADQMVELIRADWKQIGVNIELHHYQPALFFALAQNGGIIFGGKFDIVSFSWGADVIGELSNLYECNQIPPAGENDPRYCNHKVDEAMEKFKASYSAKARQPYVEFEQEQIVKDDPTFVLRIREDLFAYNVDLKGFVPGAQTRFDDMMNVTI